MEDSHKTIVEEREGYHNGQEINPCFDNPGKGLVIVIDTHGFPYESHFIIRIVWVEEGVKAIDAAAFDLIEPLMLLCLEFQLSVLVWHCADSGSHID